jgi:hypothetical protein
MPEGCAEAVLHAGSVFQTPDPVAIIVHPSPELPSPLRPLACSTAEHDAGWI